MERFINVAGAQTGPIARNESRQRVVSRLIELMREGPPGAQVENVEIEDADREGLSGFEIRR